MMKEHFHFFAVRFLTVLLLGLLALALHPWAGMPIPGIVLPRCSSPWELSKLAYWPMLAALLLTGHLSGGMKKTLTQALPSLTLTAPILFLAYWAISRLEPSWGIYLLLWILAAAAESALSRRGGKSSVWAVLAAALGLLYLIFTFCPPSAAPFLDLHDAAVMATIPC